VGALAFACPVRHIRTYVDGYRACGAQVAGRAHGVRSGERCAIPQTDRKLLPNGPYLTRVCLALFFSHHFRNSPWTLLDLQVGDDGTMYTGVCQRGAIRAVRVGEVVSDCVCMTRQISYRVVYRSSIDGILSIIKSSFNSPCRHPCFELGVGSHKMSEMIFSLFVLATVPRIGLNRPSGLSLVTQHLNYFHVVYNNFPVHRIQYGKTIQQRVRRPPSEDDLDYPNQKGG
jgi:hypothetical protein